jgi:hypothetical protein
MWCVSECDQVKINNLDTCWEQVGRRRKDYEMKRNETKRNETKRNVRLCCTDCKIIITYCTLNGQGRGVYYPPDTEQRLRMNEAVLTSCVFIKCYGLTFTFTMLWIDFI